MTPLSPPLPFWPFQISPTFLVSFFGSVFCPWPLLIPLTLDDLKSPVWQVLLVHCPNSFSSFLWVLYTHSLASLCFALNGWHLHSSSKDFLKAIRSTLASCAEIQKYLRVYVPWGQPRAKTDLHRNKTI